MTAVAHVVEWRAGTWALGGFGSLFVIGVVLGAVAVGRSLASRNGVARLLD